MDSHCTAQLTFVLGGLLGQDVALERLTAFNGTTRTDAEALFGAAFRLHFWHDTICPSGQLHFLMIAGGSNALLFDACSHLLATACAVAFAASQTAACRQKRQSARSLALTGIRNANALREKAWSTSSFSAPAP